MSETEEEIKVEHKGLKKGLYLIPSMFTAGNIAMGFLAVLSSVRGFQLITVSPENAAIYFDYAAKAIGLAILFDTLDGRLARMTKTETEIGVQLDSLADVLELLQLFWHILGQSEQLLAMKVQFTESEFSFYLCI
jgi:phosphatidylglycerophosphate synthase